MRRTDYKIVKKQCELIDDAILEQYFQLLIQSHNIIEKISFVGTNE